MREKYHLNLAIWEPDEIALDYLRVYVGSYVSGLIHTARSVDEAVVFVEGIRAQGKGVSRDAKCSPLDGIFIGTFLPADMDYITDLVYSIVPLPYIIAITQSVEQQTDADFKFTYNTSVVGIATAIHTITQAKSVQF